MSPRSWFWTVRFFQAEDGIRDRTVTGVQTCALPILRSPTFTITKNKIHYRAAGKDVRVRLILDGLQLIQEPIYGGLSFGVNSPSPLKTAEPWKGPPALGSPLGSPLDYRWYTQDVSMWLDHRAYIEVIDDGPGVVTLDRVMFSDESAPPDPPNTVLLDLLSDSRHATAADLTKALRGLGDTLLGQWEAGKLLACPDAGDRTALLNDIIRAAEPRDGYLVILGRWNEFHKADAKLWEAIFDEAKRLVLARPAPLRGLATADGTAVNEHVCIRG